MIWLLNCWPPWTNTFSRSWYHHLYTQTYNLTIKLLASMDKYLFKILIWSPLHTNVWSDHQTASLHGKIPFQDPDMITSTHKRTIWPPKCWPPWTNTFSRSWGDHLYTQTYDLTIKLLASMDKYLFKILRWSPLHTNVRSDHQTASLHGQIPFQDPEVITSTHKRTIWPSNC